MCTHKCTRKKEIGSKETVSFSTTELIYVCVTETVAANTVPAWVQFRKDIRTQREKWAWSPTPKQEVTCT